MSQRIAELAVAMRADGVETTALALNRVESAGAKAGAAFGRTGQLASTLVTTLTSMTGVASGASGALSTMATTLAPLAAGGVIGAAVIAGVGLIARRFLEMRAAADEAREAAARLKDQLDRLQDSGDYAGLTSRARRLFEGSASQGFKDGIDALQRELLAEEQKRDQAVRQRDIFAFEAAKRRVTELRAKLGPLEAEFNDIRARLMGAGPASARPRDAIVSTAARNAPPGRTPTARGERGGRAFDGRWDNPVADAFQADRLARAAAEMDPRRQLESVYGARAQIDPQEIRRFADAIALEVPQMLTPLEDALADGLANSLVGGLGDGIQRAIASGSISEGFRALGGTLLGGLGSAMRQFGEASLLTATLMEKIKASLASFLPGGAVVASLAMIALGASLQGVAQKAFGGMGRSAIPSVGVPAVGGGLQGLPQIIDRGVIAGAISPVGTPGAMGALPTRASADTYNITVIGEDDPRAQRAIVNLINNGVRDRGLALATAPGAG